MKKIELAKKLFELHDDYDPYTAREWMWECGSETAAAIEIAKILEDNYTIEVDYLDEMLENCDDDDPIRERVIEMKSLVLEYGQQINNKKDILASTLAHTIADYTIDWNIETGADDIWSEDDIWNEIPAMTADLRKNDLKTLQEIENDIVKSDHPASMCARLFHKTYMKYGLIFQAD